MRSEPEVNKALEQYADLVMRLCTVYLKNQADTEDIFQTVFLKYTLHPGSFESEEHEKAWIIRVTINACKDLLRSFFRSHTVPLEELSGQYADAGTERAQVLEAVLSLPKPYREVVYLHYYEGYTAPEIANILGKNPNTVYTHLHKARELLRNLLREEG